MDAKFPAALQMLVKPKRYKVMREEGEALADLGESRGRCYC
jgi:hypothetical protein